MENTQKKCCVVCGSLNTKIWHINTDLEYKTSEEEYTYYKCDDCVSIFIDPMPVDQLSKIYPENYYSFGEMKKSFAMTVKEYLDQKIFKKMLDRIPGETINVLDVGGGYGWLLDTIKKIEPRINITQVVDIDEKAKKIAEEKGHQYFHGTIEEFETEEKFDMVLMLNLIEHISNPLETLQNIEKLLNKGGLVLIKTPNIESWDANLFKKSYWGGLHCPRHWVLFSKTSFTHIIKKTNLSVNYINYTQGAPFWAWSFLIKLQKMGLAKITRERPVMYHPLIPALSIIFAGFDFMRKGIGFKTSQMFIELVKE